MRLEYGTGAGHHDHRMVAFFVLLDAAKRRLAALIVPDWEWRV